MHYPTIHDLNRARRLKAQRQKKYRNAVRTRSAVNEEKENVEENVKQYRKSDALDVYGESILYDAAAGIAKIDLMSTASVEELKLDSDGRMTQTGCVAFYHIHPYEDSLHLMKSILKHLALQRVGIIICDFNGYYGSEEEARRDFNLTELPAYMKGCTVVCLPADPLGKSLFSFRL